MTWDDYFMSIARTVALRGDCRRRRVGCVLVDADHRILGTGYNGAEPGGPSCLAGECPRGLLTNEQVAPNEGGYNNCIAIHAEANALIFARASCKGATAYVSSAVCPDCAKLLRGAGVARVVQPLSGEAEETILLGMSVGLTREEAQKVVEAYTAWTDSLHVSWSRVRISMLYAAAEKEGRNL